MAESLDTPLETTRRPRWLWQRSNEQSDGFGRFAEATARFMGSPKFILYMTIFVVTWIVLNVVLVQYARKYAWDAYPFILLNLAFSTQASYSAPLILLAQNRQDDRDRVTAEHVPVGARRLLGLVALRLLGLAAAGRRLPALGALPGGWDLRLLGHGNGGRVPQRALVGDSDPLSELDALLGLHRLGADRHPP